MCNGSGRATRRARFDAQCKPTHYCAGTTCTAKLADGASCLAANQGTSGACADSVCCNSVCGGTCEACNLAGSVAPARGCRRGPTRRPSVAGGLACDGARACRATCAEDSHCEATFYCNASNACAAKQATGGLVVHDAHQCLSGFCTDGCAAAACAGHLRGVQPGRHRRDVHRGPGVPGPSGRVRGRPELRRQPGLPRKLRGRRRLRSRVLLLGSACVARRRPARRAPPTTSARAATAGTGPAATRPAGAR